jgi:hypothetical protein
MRKIIPTLFALSALMAAATVLAADPTGDAAPTPRAAKRAEFQQRFFDRIDTNHDGVASRAEYQAWVDGRFDKLDSNGDGRVDAGEVAHSAVAAERVQKRAEGFVKRYDQSGSGTVDKADFEAREMARFDRLGGGADSLTADQLATHGRAHMHRHGPHGNAADADAAGG